MECLIQLQGQVVGLDTAPLIYFIKQNETYLELVRAFFQAMSQGKFQVIQVRKNAVWAVEFLKTASPEYFRPDNPGQAGDYEPQRLEDF
jgi:hypothetical protein